jgi:hypothetical protein
LGAEKSNISASDSGDSRYNGQPASGIGGGY